MPRCLSLSVCLLPLLALLVACHPNSPAQTQSSTQTQTQPPAQTQTQSATDPASGLPWINRAQLPREGQALLVQIAAGGPFRYAKDGVTFSNRERILPQQTRGYYREYTVTTPGASTRATRRIICGGQPVTSTAECYYTADHYASFRRIRP